MINSKEKIRRLGSDRFINININPMLLQYINNINSILDSSKFISGIMRFYRNKENMKVPFYRMLILSDNKVYCYRKLHSKRVVDLDKYDEIIEFSSSEESKLYWDKYIKNELIRL